MLDRQFEIKNEASVLSEKLKQQFLNAKNSIEEAQERKKREEEELDNMKSLKIKM